MAVTPMAVGGLDGRQPAHAERSATDPRNRSWRDNPVDQPHIQLQVGQKVFRLKGFFMSFSRLSIFTLALTAALAFAVDAAEARSGGGRSFGSRGSRTFDAAPPTPTAPKAAAPMERSMTQPGAPAAAQRVNPSATTAAPSLFGGFGGMLMGGFLGAGLFGLLSGNGLFGGLSGLASGLGLLLQFALIAGVAWLIVNYFRTRNRPAMAHGPARSSSALPHGVLTRSRPTGASNGGSGRLTIGSADYQAFENLLGEIQSAYGREDTHALGAMTTPEMLSYFSQGLAENAKNGLRNEVSGAKFLQGDLSEAWRENGSDYATVAMRYALIDALVERATGRVVSGDRTVPQEVTEVWTFRRDHREPAEGWQLSAIQQV
jgi:predicted lipid-binding transport protein (Tim44 family)